MRAARRTLAARGVSMALLGGTLGACSGATAAPDAVRVDPQAVRHALEAALGRLDPADPLRLRFNPAPCDCPPFELLTDVGWVRAELAGDGERLAVWMGHVAHLSGAAPLRAEVRGKVERDTLRTQQGAYAVRIDVAEPLVPAYPAPPAPPAEPVHPDEPTPPTEAPPADPKPAAAPKA